MKQKYKLPNYRWFKPGTKTLFHLSLAFPEVPVLVGTVIKYPKQKSIDGNTGNLLQTVVIQEDSKYTLEVYKGQSRIEENWGIVTIDARCVIGEVEPRFNVPTIKTVVE